MSDFKKHVFTAGLVAVAVAGMTMLGGCGATQSSAVSENKETTVEGSDDKATDKSETMVAATTKAAIKGVDKLSLYIYNKNMGLREISDGCNSTWVKGEDIVSFEAFATEDASFSLAGSNFKNVWEQYWNSFDNADSCKIGYIVDFKLKSGEEIKETIKHPDDVFGYRNYLETYLYDDVNQIQGNWYSHLLASEVTDKTVMTSIKFTAGTDIDKVGDTITLTAFVYTSDSDFDASGNYIGNVSKTVTVVNK